MSSQRAVGLSRFLALGLVPLCAWGLLSALLLHLIAIRSVFIQGGEGRLRLGVLAFAGGVVFLQRLAAQQGGEHATGYKWALIFTMALFTIQHSTSYRLPVHPALVILANGLIFAVLYWVGMKITEACAVDSDDKSAVASEMGIFGRGRRLRNDEEQLPDGPRRKNRSLFGRMSQSKATAAASFTWQERLAPQHPGRVLFYFSLFAIPAFGLGGLLLSPADGGTALLGLNIFLYLFCVLSLLFLSSFGQLAAYFEHRDVALPEVIGVTWLSLGFAAVVAIVGMSFLLPQPPSAAGGFIRDRIVAKYEGFSSSRGVHEEGISNTATGKGSGGQQGSGDGKSGSGNSESGSKSGAQQQGDGNRSGEARATAEANRESGVDKAYAKIDDRRMQGATEGFEKIFDFLLKALGVLAVLAAVIVAIVVVMAVWSGISGRTSSLRGIFPGRAKRPKAEEGAKKKNRTAGAFRQFADPASAGVANNADDLVHYLWDATLACCSDAGEPCTPDQTPYEFLQTHPEPLRTMEPEAKILARWLLHAEYSGVPVPQTALPELLYYWSKLNALR